MLAWDIFRHYILSRRSGSLVRTIAWVSVSGITIGVASLIIVTSVMRGFNENYRSRLLSIDPHLVLPIASEQLRAGDETLAKQVEAILNVAGETPAVEGVFEYESQDVIIRSLDGSFSGAEAKGLDEAGLESTLRRVQNLRRSGTESPTLSPETWQLSDREIIMGVDLARSLGLLEGDEVFLISPEALLGGELTGATQFEKVVVKSFLSTRLGEFDQKRILYRRGGIFKHLPPSASREGGLEVYLRQPQEPRLYQRQLLAKGFKSTTWIERNAVMFFALKVEKIAITTFLTLSALITSFSIVSVLVLLLHQKRKDLGLLMAIGMSPKQVLRTYTGLGVLLSCGGIILGAVIGVGVSLLLERYPLDILPDIYYDSQIPASLNGYTVLLILVVGTFLAAFAAWWPARTTSQLSPSEALRR